MASKDARGQVLTLVMASSAPLVMLLGWPCDTKGVAPVLFQIILSAGLFLTMSSFFAPAGRHITFFRGAMAVHTLSVAFASYSWCFDDLLLVPLNLLLVAAQTVGVLVVIKRDATLYAGVTMAFSGGAYSLREFGDAMPLYANAARKLSPQDTTWVVAVTTIISSIIIGMVGVCYLRPERLISLHDRARSCMQTLLAALLPTQRVEEFSGVVVSTAPQTTVGQTSGGTAPSAQSETRRTPPGMVPAGELATARAIALGLPPSFNPLALDAPLDAWVARQLAARRAAAEASSAARSAAEAGAGANPRTPSRASQAGAEGEGPQPEGPSEAGAESEGGHEV